MFKRNVTIVTAASTLLFLATLANPNPAAANEATITASNDVHAKNRLFLRGQLGFGSASTTTSNADHAVDLHGMGHAFSFSAGYTFRDNFAVYGQISQHGSRNPSLTIDSDEGSETERPDQDLLLSTTALGIGITQYFSPYNLFWDASVGVGVLSLLAENDSDSTDLGPTGSLAFGKEWIIGPHLGLGLSAQLHLSRVHDADALPDGSSGHFTSRTLVIGFSGTYN
jgi:hypothetical protein